MGSSLDGRWLCSDTKRAADHKSGRPSIPAASVGEKQPANLANALFFSIRSESEQSPA